MKPPSIAYAGFMVGQVLAPAEPGSELIKLALNAGITGVFALYIWWSKKEQQAESDSNRKHIESLIGRVEKMEERKIEADRINRAELIGAIKEIQADNRSRSDGDRALVRDVVTVMGDVKKAIDLQSKAVETQGKAVEAQEQAIRSLDGMFRAMQSEFVSLREVTRRGPP